MKLLTKSNAKTVKGEKRGYQTFILYLAPGDLSGYEVCGGRSPGCTSDCLFTAGRGRMSNIQQARIRKTKFFFEDRDQFMAQLVRDVVSAIASSKRKGLTPVFRLNGTSDIPWESIKCGEFKNIFARFPDVIFYDYTKVLGRIKIPHNYHLTFSRSETNEDSIRKAFAKGMNVAVVFDSLPPRFKGYPVINGDNDDLRFLDTPMSIVGLLAKGKAIKSTSNFVIRTQDGNAISNTNNTISQRRNGKTIPTRSSSYEPVSTDHRLRHQATGRQGSRATRA
jgi:hypothetical protein